MVLHTSRQLQTDQCGALHMYPTRRCMRCTSQAAMRKMNLSAADNALTSGTAVRHPQSELPPLLMPGFESAGAAAGLAMGAAAGALVTVPIRGS